jgi:hypothetical protein
METLARRFHGTSSTTELNPASHLFNSALNYITIIICIYLLKSQKGAIHIFGADTCNNQHAEHPCCPSITCCLSQKR